MTDLAAEAVIPPPPEPERLPMLRRALLSVLAPALLLPVGIPAQAQAPSPERLDRLARERRGEALTLYRDLLRLPNDAHHPEDIRRLLDFLEDRFRERGFETERMPTEGGSPFLLAEREAPGAERTVLVYLQADGQPVDPSAWNQESPYEPVLKERAPDGSWRRIPWSRLRGEIDPEWRIFARSASDSKGPNAQFLAAMDVLEAAGSGPSVNLKVVVDTEEEMGSPRLPAAVERFRERLAADWLVIFDGPPHGSEEPTLKFGARGIATVTLVTYGPRVPQHSGHYGNYAPNPVYRMARILDSFKDEAGRVVIPGWYDGITLGDDVLEALAAVPDDEAQIQRELGVAMIDSVAPTLQRAIQYPSLNVRGIAAGWIGSQARTIIPDTATAELDVRLVAESDPDRLIRLIREHVEGLGFTVLDHSPTEEERLTHPRIARMSSTVSYGAFRTAFDSDLGLWLRAGMERLHGEEPILLRTSGGSIPISPFVNTLGIPAVSVPTVNPDNNQHSPNENLKVGAYLQGIRTIAAVLSEPTGGR